MKTGTRRNKAGFGVCKNEAKQRGWFANPQRVETDAANEQHHERVGEADSQAHVSSQKRPYRQFPVSKSNSSKIDTSTSAITHWSCVITWLEQQFSRLSCSVSMLVPQMDVERRRERIHGKRNRNLCYVIEIVISSKSSMTNFSAPVLDEV